MARPFDPSREDRLTGYVRVLEFDRPFDLWSSIQLPGFSFTRAPTDDPEDQSLLAPSFSMVLAGKEDEVFPDQAMERYGGNDLNGRMNMLDEDLALITACWALLWAVRAHETRVAQLRDQLVAVDVARVRKAAKRLQGTESKLIRLSGDALPLASDIASQKERLPRTFRFYSGLDFEETETRGDDAPRRWVEATVDWIALRAENLGRFTREVREFEAGVSNALTARANLRLQRWIAILSIILLVVGVLSLVVTAVALRNDLDPLWDFLRSLWPS